MLRRDVSVEMSLSDAADFEEACLAIAQSVAQIDAGETFSLEECKAHTAAKWAQYGISKSDKLPYTEHST